MDCVGGSAPREYEAEIVEIVEVTEGRVVSQGLALGQADGDVCGEGNEVQGIGNWSRVGEPDTVRAFPPKITDPNFILWGVKS